MLLPLIVSNCLDSEKIKIIEPILQEHRGPISYVSLQGIKDIILQSSQSEMTLFHIQFGLCTQKGYANPIDGYIHMFCIPIGDPLVVILEKQDVYPSATATVIHHGMERWN